MSFYITTPIYYVNDTPHIGHAYTTVVADVLTRYHKLFGEKSYFLTGTDEHGQKVQKAALNRGMAPQDHVDEMVVHFKNIWKELQIDNDFFIRTTMPFHKKCVQECLQELYDRGEIYSQDYEGWYSESEEVFYTEKELVDGKTPQGNSVQKVSEKNYFFKMSQYRDRLIEHIEKNPQFIQPDVRRNETLGFLKKGLGDLCISRPKKRLEWGIELPFDSDYVTYVWFDALLNYATAVGLHQNDKKETFDEFWPEVIHLIGKDILMTHSIYWPTMLMALNLSLPKTIFAHGWWLTESSEKMSKSKGAVVRPLDMKDIVGIAGLRYFLTRDIYLGSDAQFSSHLVVNRVNTELANNLGNLLSRTTNLIHKYFDSKIPKVELKENSSLELSQKAVQIADQVKLEIEKLAPNLAIGHIVDLLSDANRYLEEQAPWKKAKESTELAKESLYCSVEVLRISAILLSPVMPLKMKELLERLGMSEEITFNSSKEWGVLTSENQVIKDAPLFPRIEIEKK